jgi:D-threo-aldose 1-dehydrogenase
MRAWLTLHIWCSVVGVCRGRGAVTAAHDSGVGFFDTAPWYGRGASERRLGVALSQFSRDTFKLQTKV